MTKIGEDVSKRLDVIPAQWRALVTRRPKYMCRRCSGPVVQAARTGACRALRAADQSGHCARDRLQVWRPYASLPSGRSMRQGIRLGRTTLGNLSGRACFYLQPIAGHMRRRLARADRLFMDETTAPVLDPRARPNVLRLLLGGCLR
ncbi:IS66 family transposase zinc-finger binding domain-containing protein [Bradyrhizobium yuanmingense]|uniref:IS66 family transposase zinc-finger binding domain-containing protein n=1 Tax=Bradyrhizobium yuanmingense TaxID=108015 RepID=UPI003518E14C